MTDNTQPEAPLGGRWYMVTKDGAATLCIDQEDAQDEAVRADRNWPRTGPHRAVKLVEASEAGFTAADMATAEALGFRDGVASIAANAGEPRALNPRHIRKFLQALQAGEMSVSRAVEILDAWVGGYYEDEMVPLPPPDSCLIADDEFPMEIVRKLRSELAAAPPTAQAEGWIKASKQLPPCRGDQLYIGVNSAGYAGVFNAVASIAGNVHCMYETPEETIDVMSDLSIWKPFTPPTSAEGVEHG